MFSIKEKLNLFIIIIIIIIVTIKTLQINKIINNDIKIIYILPKE